MIQIYVFSRLWNNVDFHLPSVSSLLSLAECGFSFAGSGWFRSSLASNHASLVLSSWHASHAPQHPQKKMLLFIFRHFKKNKTKNIKKTEKERCFCLPVFISSSLWESLSETLSWWITVTVFLVFLFPSFAVFPVCGSCKTNDRRWSCQLEPKQHKTKHRSVF